MVEDGQGALYGEVLEGVDRVVAYDVVLLRNLRTEAGTKCLISRVRHVALDALLLAITEIHTGPISSIDCPLVGVETYLRYLFTNTYPDGKPGSDTGL